MEVDDDLAVEVTLGPAVACPSVLRASSAPPTADAFKAKHCFLCWRQVSQPYRPCQSALSYLLWPTKRASRSLVGIPRNWGARATCCSATAGCLRSGRRTDKSHNGSPGPAPVRSLRERDQLHAGRCNPPLTPQPCAETSTIPESPVSHVAAACSPQMAHLDVRKPQKDQFPVLYRKSYRRQLFRNEPLRLCTHITQRGGILGVIVRGRTSQSVGPQASRRTRTARVRDLVIRRV